MAQRFHETSKPSRIERSMRLFKPQCDKEHIRHVFRGIVILDCETPPTDAVNVPCIIFCLVLVGVSRFDRAAPLLKKNKHTIFLELPSVRAIREFVSSKLYANIIDLNVFEVS